MSVVEKMWDYTWGKIEKTDISAPTSALGQPNRVQSASPVEKTRPAFAVGQEILHRRSRSSSFSASAAECTSRPALTSALLGQR
ncbi:unnamed protein product [Linum trigynum]|uniref:Uncharacterized protein n=1 Tax=Linum trigynum TaxID=586398 RepID=A0AAV2DAI3_9ROSI